MEREESKGRALHGRQESRFYLVLLLIAVIPLFSLGLSNHGVWTADEPRVAEIGREMALSGNWAVPTLNREPFLEEPPLYYAAIGAVFRLFGAASDRIVRIPSALFAFGGVLALFFLGRRLFGPRTGFLSAFILATSGEYFRVAHWVIVDSALTFFVILSLTFFVSAYLSEGRTRRLVSYILCYVSCTLAFYSKGFVGVAIPGLAVVAFLIADRNLKEVLRMRLWLGVVIFLAMTLPWFFALWQQGGPEYLKIFLVHNHLERFAGGSTGHAQPFYYYLTQFPGGFLPWSLLVVPALYRGFLSLRHTEGAHKRGVLLALCWFVTGFVFLSAASTKRVLYLMPILAPISLFTALYIEATLVRADRKRWFETFFTLAFGIAVLVVSLAIVPLFFYASRKFGFGYSVGEALRVVLFALVAAVLAVMALARYGKNMARFWTCSGGAVFALLLLGAVAVCPLLDPYKSFVPFCDAIRAALPAGSPLYGYQPDETLKGAVPFYTGQFLREIDTPAALVEVIQRERAVFVVIRDKRGKVEEELLATGKMSVLARFGMDSTRSLVLLKGVEGPPEGGRRARATGP
ncbi:MAG: glycosyltransferase family 39 protein [Syntrophorhabdales bacterium]